MPQDELVCNVLIHSKAAATAAFARPTWVELKINLAFQLLHSFIHLPEKTLMLGILIVFRRKPTQFFTASASGRGSTCRSLQQAESAT
jgi:hypothetical protein